MARRNSKSLSKTIVAAIAILLLIVLVVGLVMCLNGGVDNDVIKDILDSDRLVVSANGNRIEGSASGYYLSARDPIEIAINSADFSIRIIANTSISFDIDVAEGNFLSYVAVGDDLTNGFNIVNTDDGFLVLAKGDMTTVLSEAYPNLLIDMDKASMDVKCDMFTLIISSSKADIKIGFSLYPINGVVLDKTEIIL